MNKEIEEIINLKKPRKLKVIKMIFTIFKHLFGSIYFFFVLLCLYLVKKYYKTSLSSIFSVPKIGGRFL